MVKKAMSSDGVRNLWKEIEKREKAPSVQVWSCRSVVHVWKPQEVLIVVLMPNAVEEQPNQTTFHHDKERQEKQGLFGTVKGETEARFFNAGNSGQLISEAFPGVDEKLDQIFLPN